jgi:hypothetical protein
MCFLAKDCDNPGYQKIIMFLCTEAKVSLIEVETRELLGELCGMVKVTSDGEEYKYKVVKCSVAVITDYGDESSELQRIVNSGVSTISTNHARTRSDEAHLYSRGDIYRYQFAAAKNPQFPWKNHDMDPTFGKSQFKSSSKNLFDHGGSELNSIYLASQRDQARRERKNETKHNIGNRKRSEKSDR